MNLGEELVASYLEYIKGCEFIQQNLYTPEVQGEIDVVGLDLHSRSIYICEVAIHLQTGLQYTKDNRPNNVNKLIEKFSKDIEYANKYFPEYKKIFMLWTPIIKRAKEDAKNDQERDLEIVKTELKSKYQIDLELVINDRFLECIKEMRKYASEQTEDIKSVVLRLFQIEEYTKKHVEKMDKKNNK